MSEIRLSKIDDSNLTDDQIEEIVFSGISDDGKNSEYALVFGNSMLIKERVNTAVKAYNDGRVKKVIFMGGVNGVSNQDNSKVSEAEKMKELAIHLGIKEEDILMDTTSNNTFENIENAMKLLPNNIKHIIIITSEFHLKRCYAILQKRHPEIEVTMIPSNDVFSDKENWRLSDNSWNSGRSLVTYEAHLLVRYAKENKIYDLEIKGDLKMDLREINNRISDRSDCFYWQTDRKISAEEAAVIWKDRHSAITNEELFAMVNSQLDTDKLKSIYPFDINAQTSFGNVNSIRVGLLESKKEVIIRCHPKGIKNGYFHSESLAAQIALKNGIPAYKTYLIHDLESDDDISYQVIEKLSGDTVQTVLGELKEKDNEKYKEKDKQLSFEMGKMMAKLHKIRVTGFGPFRNEDAKNGSLVGTHATLSESINAGLSENLDRLVKYNILTPDIAEKMRLLFENNPLLDFNEPVLIHNDFADWNLLTDGNTITGVIDWDECVGGHPIQEIACWSTFFDPERLPLFLEGYFSETKKPENFEELFQLFRLRYTISKMALRIKRYTYEQSPFVKTMIEKGEKHLEELSRIYKLK